MKYLLDTQIAIWSLEDHANLKPAIRNILENPDNSVLISPISLIEISIKLKLGKLPQFTVGIEEVASQLLRDGFEILPLVLGQIYAYQLVPFYDDHRDPFDRMLLAISLHEQIPIISSDEKFERYQPLISVLIN
ncbi:type II toxin-antitoxin system VapC family toxin [Dyadobacter sp. CY261]|uniref:type II toxin-antitoxin system VapC family toxin n=1 Tax=Dyadobacter sp. CY261 TaxID=2907203 RepID=UPI001F1A59E6|nr:type II toxin-antitoxin system VapC family toxin [Dyadobacter sp. CY261]MCF0073356.1 type II toxin-antitoxin system VapC family toxin [Dyadobacter sp. CY261]